MEKERINVFESIVNASGSHNAVIVVDNSFHVQFSNPRVEELFGFSKEELLGKVLPFILEKEWQKITSAVKDIQTKDQLMLRVWARTKQNRTFPVIVTFSGMVDEKRDLVGYCMLFQSAIKKTIRQTRRTFRDIRNHLLAVLKEEPRTVNQLATHTAINWKTVESHLNYLKGKGCVREIFSSKYVRIFEITKLGKQIQNQNQLVIEEN